MKFQSDYINDRFTKKKKNLRIFYLSSTLSTITQMILLDNSSLFPLSDETGND